MKLLFAALLAFQSFNSVPFIGPTGEPNVPAESHVRLIANVRDSDHEYMTIVVEEVVSYSSSVHTTPAEGDEIYVRLTGGERPDMESRIAADLQEKIEVGEMQCAYILIDYRTLE